MPCSRARSIRAGASSCGVSGPNPNDPRQRRLTSSPVRPRYSYSMCSGLSAPVDPCPALVERERNELCHRSSRFSRELGAIGRISLHTLGSGHDEVLSAVDGRLRHGHSCRWELSKLSGQMFRSPLRLVRHLADKPGAQRFLGRQYTCSHDELKRTRGADQASKALGAPGTWDDPKPDFVEADAEVACLSDTDVTGESEL